MGENIVERLARIIDPTAFKAWQSSYDYNLAQGETDEGARGYADWSQKAACDEALAKARKILAALREPSDAMIEAGAKCHDSNMGPLTIGALNARRNVRQILVAAIDTALTEGTEHDQG